MDRIPAIDPGLSGLEHASPAGPFPFLAEGERIWVRGTASRAGFSVGSGGRRLADVETAGLGAAANVLLFPGVVRRDIGGPTGSCVETLLALPTLPVLVAQWRSDATALPSAITVRVPGGDGASLFVEGVRVRGDDGFEAFVTPADGPPRIHPGREGDASVVFQVTGPGPVTLVVAHSAGTAPGTGPEAGVAARHSPAHAVRAAAGPDGGVSLHTGIPAVDDGIRWLRARIAGQARRLSADADPEAALVIGLACCAGGDAEAAAAVLGALPADRPEHALLAARYAATFDRHRPALAASRLLVRATGAPAGAASLRSLAAGRLAEALHQSADADTIAKLRGMAGPDGPPGPPASTASRRTGGIGERRLPMAGNGADLASWLGGLLRGEPTPPAPRAGRTDLVTARGLPAGFLRDPDAAWVEWRRMVDTAHASVGPALWDSPNGGLEEGRGEESSSEFAEGSLAAHLLLALTAGLLGVDPDASVGRIRIAPRLPGHLSRFEVSGIGVGSSSISLRYSAADGHLRFDMTPDAATVPPLLVFEPSVPGTVRDVLVDGGVADLELRPAQKRTVVPVQLPLDAPRRVEIVVDRTTED